MRCWIFAALLMWAAGTASAADTCPTLRHQTAAEDLATRIAAVACNEHALWYRPFIDRNGRMASSTVVEAEASLLDDGATPAWRRVASYWQESGLLPQMAGFPGADACGHAGEGVAALACRAFVVDNPWSAAFVSWVMRKAALPGFRASASHIDYVRDAYLRPQDNAYDYLDPATAAPAAGDLLCYVRVGSVYGYAGLRAVAARSGTGLNMHCDVVVAANPDNDATAYLVGGNVQQGVTLRMLALNRNGLLWGLPQRSEGQPPCAPDNESGCNFNRQDWAVLLKLKPAPQLARLPPPPAPAPALPALPAAPSCCVNCVVGGGIPRCPKPPTP